MNSVWRGKKCVVTGGTSGVGRVLVRRLAEQGAHIGVIARGQDGLDATAREIHDGVRRCHTVSADVADADAVFRAADEIATELGGIDVWFNNAMTTVFSWIEELDPAELRRVTDVTYHGAVWGTLAALRHLPPGGAIIQVGSALAYRAIPLQAAYCGAKHAMRAFTDSLRSELIANKRDIQVTMVHLPGLNTPQFEHCRSKLGVQPQPVAPIYDPDVAARGILLAAEHNRREAFVGFPTVKTVFGSQVAPGFLDGYLARNVIEGQKTSTPATGKDNLFSPVAGDPGARGPFTDQSKSSQLPSSVMSWMGAGGMRAAAITAAVSTIALATIWAYRRAT